LVTTARSGKSRAFHAERAVVFVPVTGVPRNRSEPWLIASHPAVMTIRSSRRAGVAAAIAAIAVSATGARHMMAACQRQVRGAGDHITMIVKLSRGRPAGDDSPAGQGRGSAAGPDGPPDGHVSRPGRGLMSGLLVLAVAVAAGASAYAVTRPSRPGVGQDLRPSGVPASTSTRLADT